MTNIAANYGTAPETARHRDFRYASGTRPVPCRSCTTQHACHHGAPACGVWAGPQPSSMPDANRLNATAADHHDAPPKSPYRGMRATLKPVPPMVPEKCRTRMPCHGAHGAESRATSRTPYTGRFCGRRDYLMPTPPCHPKEIVHRPRHSPACPPLPPKHRHHIPPACGKPSGTGTGTILTRSMHQPRRPPCLSRPATTITLTGTDAPRFQRCYLPALR